MMMHVQVHLDMTRNTSVLLLPGLQHVGHNTRVPSKQRHHLTGNNSHRTALTAQLNQCLTLLVISTETQGNSALILHDSL